MSAPRTRRALERIQPYVPGRPIEEVQKELGLSRVVKLASNENPLGPSPLALEALARAAASVHRYPEGTARALREAIGARVGLPPEQVLVGNGSDEVLQLIGLAFLEPWDEAVVPTPSFAEYDFVVHLMGAALRTVPLRDYTVDVDAVLEAVSPNTRLLFLANPNNPTGTRLPAAEFTRLVESLPETVILVVDEAYREYFPDEYPDPVQYVREGRNLVVLRTFSKIYGLAGLRIGYALATAPVAAALHRVRQPFNTSTVAQAAALAALGDDDHVRRSRERNRQGLEELRAICEGAGWSAPPSYTNFLFAATGRDADRLARALLAEGVIVRPGSVFGCPEHLRISTGTAEEHQLLAAALDRVLRKG